MYQISDDFRAALKKSHRIATRVEVWAGGQPTELDVVVEGGVSVDVANAVRRRARITLVDEAGIYTPDSASDLLAPFGNELKLYRGLRLDTDELVPLGVFGISQVDIDDSGESLTVQVLGYDRSRKVQRARPTDVYVVPEGDNIAEAIEDCIDDGVPGLTYNFTATTLTTPQLVLERGGDRWDFVSKMAESIGAELFFDVDGVCVLRPIPDPLTDAVTWNYVEGEEATILSLSKSLTDERTYNHWIVTGESTSASEAVVAEAVDDDTQSPTYYLGDYGDVPFFYQSPFITTETQAQDVADGLKRKAIGAIEVVRFNSLVNPAHDTGDVIYIARDRAKIDTRYVLDAFTLPLGGGSMSATTRKRAA